MFHYGYVTPCQRQTGSKDENGLMVRVTATKPVSVTGHGYVERIERR